MNHPYGVPPGLTDLWVLVYKERALFIRDVGTLPQDPRIILHILASQSLRLFPVTKGMALWLSSPRRTARRMEKSSQIQGSLLLDPELLYLTK